MESKTYALVVKGLSRLPVTEEIAGSNPVGPAKIKKSPIGGFLILNETRTELDRRSRFAGSEALDRRVAE